MTKRGEVDWSRVGGGTEGPLERIRGYHERNPARRREPRYSAKRDLTDQELIQNFKSAGSLDDREMARHQLQERQKMLQQILELQRIAGTAEKMKLARTLEDIRQVLAS